MNCYPELSLAVYLDGEAEESLAVAISGHLDACSACRSRMNALRLENETLSEAVLTGMAEPVPERHHGGWTSIAAMSALALLFGLPLNGLPALDWSHLSICFGVTSYLLSQGPSLLPVAAAILVFLLAAEMLRRREPAFARVALCLLAAVALAVPGQAVTIRKGGNVIRVAQGETVNETLVAIGQEIHIDGTVNGDLVALGETVVVSGAVNGDIVMAGKLTQVRGKVAGNLLGAGSTVEVSGQVRGNVYFVGSSLRLLSGGVVEGEVVGAGEVISLDGDVKRGVLLGGQAASVSGAVGRDLYSHCDRLTVLAPARIAGKVTAWVPSATHVNVESGAEVAGGVNTQVRATSGHQAQRSPFLTWSFYFGMLREFLGAVIASCVLFLVARGFFIGAAARARSFWRSFGLGFAVLFAAPVAIFLIAITWIGIPMALIVLAAYLAALYVSKIVVAAFLGQLFLHQTPTRMRDWALVTLSGLLVLTLAFHIPYHIGFGLRVAVLCFGLGALVWQGFHSARTAE